MLSVRAGVGVYVALPRTASERQALNFWAGVISSAGTYFFGASESRTHAGSRLSASTRSTESTRIAIALLAPFHSSLL